MCGVDVECWRTPGGVVSVVAVLDTSLVLINTAVWCVHYLSGRF